jgi:Beta-propeller repeat
VYVCGATVSFNFPTTTGSYQPFYHGAGGEPEKKDYSGGDAFVAKFNSSGQRVYVTYLGGSDDDLASAIAVDSSGNVYVCGYTISKDFPTTPGAYQQTLGGTAIQNTVFNFGDGFVAKLNPAGSALVFSTYFGGTGDDTANGLAVDTSGNVYFTGFTTSMNLQTSAEAFQPNYAGYTTLPQDIFQLTGDAYVAKLNSTGSSLAYAENFLAGFAGDEGTPEQRGDHIY